MPEVMNIAFFFHLYLVIISDTIGSTMNIHISPGGNYQRQENKLLHPHHLNRNRTLNQNKQEGARE